MSASLGLFVKKGEAEPVAAFEKITEIMLRAYHGEDSRKFASVDTIRGIGEALGWHPDAPIPMADFRLASRARESSKGEMRMETRVYCLDKLRNATILCVVSFHSAVGYSGSAPFWPFRGEQAGRGLDLILYIADIVMMPLMFFIAGYFALSSYRRRGGKGFLGPKLRRLGIPWLAVSFLRSPRRAD